MFVMVVEDNASATLHWFQQDNDFEKLYLLRLDVTEHKAIAKTIDTNCLIS